MLKKPADQELTTIRDRLKEIERIAASTGTQRFWYETQYGGKGLPWLEQERDNLQMMLKLREQSQPVQFGGDLLPPTSTPPPATTGSGAGRAQPSETDQLAVRVESLRQSLMTEAELEEQSYAQRMETLAAYYEGREGIEGEWRDLSLRAQQEYADNMNAIAERQAERDQQIRDMTWRGVSDTLGSLSDLAATFGEKGFLASKAFGIGQAVVNTAVGVTEALKLPPPANFAAAAAVAAAGAAQIASIAAARPGGSSRPSVPYSSVATAAPAGSNDSASRAPAYVEIKGDVFSRQAVIELMRQIGDLMGDGYELKY